MEHPPEPLGGFSREKWAYIMEAFASAMSTMPYETQDDKDEVEYVQDAFHLLQSTMRARDYK
jgi:hypothetical protein